MALRSIIVKQFYLLAHAHGCAVNPALIHFGGGLTVVQHVHMMSGMVQEDTVPQKKVRFGERVTRLMEAAKLNQTELAKKAGIERSTLSRLVNNKREPRSDEMEWLAAGLNVSVEELCRDVMFEGQPPVRDEREAQLATRILAVETALEQAQSRATALEQSVASALAEVEKVQAQAARRETQIRAEAEREMARLQKEFNERERELRRRLEQRVQSVQDELAESRTENSKLRQELFTKEFELSIHKAQMKALAERAQTLESALAEAKGRAVISGLFGAFLGAAMASDDG